MKSSLRLLLWVFPLILLGCGGRAPAAEASADEASAASPGDAAAAPAIPAAQGAPPEAEPSPDTLRTPPWTRNPEAQPYMAWLQQNTPPGMGFSPGTTPWRPKTLELPPRLTRWQLAEATSPQRLLAELALALEPDGEPTEGVWEQTVRIWHEGDDRAVAVVLQWGLADDAVAGQDLRVHMLRSDDRWHIERVEERLHCSRGVTAEGLCR